MSTIGYYYLHTNGDLIFKKFYPYDNSDFVKKIWKIDSEDRQDAWIIVTESLALGANIKRIKDLSVKWRLDAKDLEEFIVRVIPTQLMKDGLHIFIQKILNIDPNTFWDNLLEKHKENKNVL